MKPSLPIHSYEADSRDSPDDLEECSIIGGGAAPYPCKVKVGKFMCGVCCLYIYGQVDLRTAGIRLLFHVFLSVYVAANV